MRLILATVCGAPAGFVVTLIGLYIRDAVTRAQPAHDEIVSGAGVALGLSAWVGAMVGLLLGVVLEVRASFRRVKAIEND